MRQGALDAAVARLRKARAAVAFTGAGISTASGLPDFRSPQGLWATVDPATVASRSAFERDPRRFYQFYRERLDRLRHAAPNAAHHAIAALERAGRLRGVITQNVDGLHQAAGSRRVIELHGNLREAVCPRCEELWPIAVVVEALAQDRVPLCQRCGAVLKPNVVLFEDLLPARAWQAAAALARAADVMLVVGSSLQVTPAAYLPQDTLDAGGVLVIVNREPTPYDDRAAVVLRADAALVLPAIAAALGAWEDRCDAPPNHFPQPEE
ncbi:MAG: NAD-dependent protein deacylase [Armatimonadota bacterium]|nr:NAD-dependent protein deacylase [Armatimonadota bacterium]MDR7532908.1 NAD-dependent protein deacylase [Armatimonadota bacterium]MDR7536115.1 NAD-dependent protein deacylase [Armatimonadota bacterium]